MFAAWLIKLLHNDEDIKYSTVYGYIYGFYSFTSLILCCLWERNVELCPKLKPVYIKLIKLI